MAEGVLNQFTGAGFVEVVVGKHIPGAGGRVPLPEAKMEVSREYGIGRVENVVC